MLRWNVVLVVRSHAPCCQLHRDGPREWWGRTVLSNQSAMEQVQVRARDIQSRMNAAAAQRISYDNQTLRVADGNQARARSTETVKIVSVIFPNFIGLRLSIDWRIGSWIVLGLIDWLIDWLIFIYSFIYLLVGWMVGTGALTGRIPIFVS